MARVKRYESGLLCDPITISPETTVRQVRQLSDQHGVSGFPVLEGKTVVSFCTGGIRCEKSTAFLKAEGIDSVFHLQGGILKYLETVPAEDSLWQGECFVFDERVTVGHGLTPGTYALCHACNQPVSAEDQASPLYLPGESCPACAD